MYYHHFLTAVFENADGIIKIGLTIPSQMHSKNLRILRSLELYKKEDSSFRTIVNIQLFSLRCLGPLY